MGEKRQVQSEKERREKEREANEETAARTRLFDNARPFPPPSALPSYPQLQHTAPMQQMFVGAMSALREMKYT